MLIKHRLENLFRLLGNRVKIPDTCFVIGNTNQKVGRMRKRVFATTSCVAISFKRRNLDEVSRSISCQGI